MQVHINENYSGENVTLNQNRKLMYYLTFDK